jgi:hypothetical protein
MAASPHLQEQLDRIALDCEIYPYLLKAGEGPSVSLTVRPNVRAAPLSDEKLACVQRELAKIPGAQLRGV